MMLQKKVSTSRLKPVELKSGQEVSNNTIEQFKLLQNTLGNQKVQEFVNSGVISLQKAPENHVEVQLQKQQEKETEQIRADRQALAEEVQAEVKKQTQLLEELKAGNPGKGIYANVTTELHYVQVPGDNALEFYHYTSLKNVDLSLANLNTTGKLQEGTRGYIIEVTDSFLLDPNAAELKAQEEDPAEETGEQAATEEIQEEAAIIEE